jgi:hypothetical protein
MQLALLKGDQLEYKCHACGWHSVPVKIGVKEGKFWEWNGNLEKPTISPSVRHFHHGMPKFEDHDAIPAFCCHYIMTDGVMAFCGDCTHSKSGQTLPMLPYTEVEVKLHSLPD